MKPPPLTRKELLAIREEHRQNRTVWRLLHDVSRLRGIVLSLRQYFELEDAKYEHAGRMRENLIERITEEACIKEDDADREALRAELRKVRGR